VIPEKRDNMFCVYINKSTLIYNADDDDENPMMCEK
jgi:hypothetical protein